MSGWFPQNEALVGDYDLQQIETFFAAYEDRANRGIAGEEVAQEVSDVFAGYFVESSPAGVMGGKNDAAFRKRIPEGYAFYKKIGTKAMKIKSIHTTPLNDLHCMARVEWQAFYEKKTGPDLVLEFDVIYLLAKQNNQWKIFAYITGDEQGEMKKHGLIE